MLRVMFVVCRSLVRRCCSSRVVLCCLFVLGSLLVFVCMWFVVCWCL